MEPSRLYDLIRRYADDKATPEETQELHEWYRSVNHAGEVDWPVEDPAEEEELRQRIWDRLRPQPRSFRVVPLFARVAACLVLLAGAWMVWRYLGNRRSDQITVFNPSGKIQDVSLPDGSHVWLNAVSTLRYEKKFGRNRELFLEGEGYFDVASDPDHPFVVHAGSLTTTVLGTSFDVRSFGTDSGITVTVIRGKVEVDDDGKVLDQLTPARQLQWNDKTRQSRTVTVDTSGILAWQQGILKFDNETLETIAGALSRWYNVKILFKDSALRNCRLLGEFSNQITLPELLNTLSNVIDLHWTMDEKKRIVLLSGRDYH